MRVVLAGYRVVFNDCAHAFDYRPAISADMFGPLDLELFYLVDDMNTGAIYRDAAYARAETERLAEQLAAMS